MTTAVFVEALPFHRWVLNGLRQEALRAGWTVIDLTHKPQHPHDWLSAYVVPGGRLYEKLREADADVVIAAEYPYGLLREAACAPVVAVRHSLAARGNTWMKEQLEADAILTWSAWDDAEFRVRHTTGEYTLMRTGCVWLDGMNAPKPLTEKPIVAWCPTWNGEFSHRVDVETQLDALAKQDGWNVVVRPHPATAWREPSWLEVLRQRGFEVCDPDVSPAPLLTRASVLVTDVSGIGLLALGVRDADLPVVHVDPRQDVLRGSAQYDPSGPEWSFRSRLGHVCPQARRLHGTIAGAHADDEFRQQRRLVRDTILGEPQWSEGACRRAVQMIEQGIGTGALARTTRSVG